MHGIRYNQSITPLTVPFFSAFLIIFGLSRCFTHRCSSSRLLARACVRSPVQQFFGHCGAVRTRRSRRRVGTGFISRLFWTRGWVRPGARLSTSGGPSKRRARKPLVFLEMSLRFHKISYTSLDWFTTRCVCYKKALLFHKNTM